MCELHAHHDADGGGAGKDAGQRQVAATQGPPDAQQHATDEQVEQRPEDVRQRRREALAGRFRGDLLYRLSYRY